MMKKISVIACLLLGVLSAQAQHQVVSFFDEVGTARIRTEEFSQAHDTIMMVDHRLDDVIWSRYIYRIIDLRYKQNYQLYFPTRVDDPDYRNLFKVIVYAVVDGLPIYPKSPETIKPDFRSQEPFTKAQIPIDAMMIVDKSEDHSDDADVYWDISRSTAMLVNYDSIADELRFQPYSFEDVVKNQIKYLIQEVVFFDKHTSRMHQKIMAIAPMHPILISSDRGDSTKVMSMLREEIMFWIPFDALRPYLAMQYAIPNRNEVKRVTYDEFFQKRLYTSYIVGEGNMYNRWIPDYKFNDVEGIKKEQERIATELLNFEQDLWEY